MNTINFIDYVISMDKSEVSRCILCHDPVCTGVCPQKAPVGEILRSMYFENYVGAVRKIGNTDCTYCNAPCEKVCVLNKDSVPVEIDKTLMNMRAGEKYLPRVKISDVDLTTDICGIKMENPFMLSSSVVSSTYEMCKRAFEAGWAGVSFKTICNFPQHETSPRFSAIRSHANSFCGFKNIEQLSDHSVEENMEIFRKLREEFPTKVIMASIMGRDEAEWTDLARKCEQA